MKFREYLKAINELAEERPELLNKDVVYSHDDEGNHYQPVNNYPCIAQAENPKEHYIDMIGIGDEDVLEANCIMIN